MLTFRRVLVWGCMCVYVASGCGGRLAGGDGDGGEDAAPTPGTSGSSGGSGSSGSDTFFVCPSSAPAVESPCDSPQRVCVYPSFSGCVSFVCSSHGWQASHEGC